ncbi:E6 [Gammapapillomavirus 7]|uniref:Protein E6 n=2 Tax=Papillomaviridae TaxID=151340 RepID=A0A2D2AL86_9PAPI|nr:E6 [Gammapapillomavirus 7]AYA94425.1 MAG: E6 protein [Human papillomavirus]
MEPPGSIYSLCDSYGCTLENLNICCLFCRSPLSYNDILSFSVKQLRVVIRDNTFFAACCTCLQLSAAYEQRTYCQCTATAEFVKFMCGGDYCNLNVRCIKCIKRLDLPEVLECLESELPFYLVRCIWRSECRLCRN